jgi:hypothetical protein
MAVSLQPAPTTGGGMMNAPPGGGPAVPTAADAPPEQAPPGAGVDVKDPKLTQIIKGVEGKIEPELRQDYEKIVTASMKILFAEQTHHLLVIAAQKIQAGDPKEIPTTVAKISAGIIGLINKEIKGALKPPPCFYAVVTIMCHILEYLESTGLQISDELIGETIKQSYQDLLDYFKITPEMLDRAHKLRMQGPEALKAAAAQEAAQGSASPAPSAAPAGPQPTGMMNSAPGM